jgi:hypothetical protein
MNLRALPSPVLLRGDEVTAYRDPTAILDNDVLRLFFTLTRRETDGGTYMYTAISESRDLLTWTAPRLLTPRDPHFNFSSPGNIVRVGDEWVLCLQTYPRPNGEKYGNGTARLWTMRSKDLSDWSTPELLRVKGPDVPVEAMGRMIDPYLLEDKDDPGKWWCFYKQDGVSMSWSRNLTDWTYFGKAAAGENVCVVVDKDEYVLFHSPENGIGVKRSRDMIHWRESGDLITLGQRDWPWAQGRLTAGFILDLRQTSGIGKYLMFFHGSGPENEETMFDNDASIGITWSDDLVHWEWPDKQ